MHLILLIFNTNMTADLTTWFYAAYTQDQLSHEKFSKMGNLFFRYKKQTPKDAVASLAFIL